MERYRRKPTEVTARQVTAKREKVMMKGNRAELLASHGDWVVTEIETEEVTVLSDRTFKALYEVQGETGPVVVPEGFEYDPEQDVLVIEGVRYSRELFRALSPMGMDTGVIFRLHRSRKGNTFFIERVECPFATHLERLEALEHAGDETVRALRTWVDKLKEIPDAECPPAVNWVQGRIEHAITEIETARQMKGPRSHDRHGRQAGFAGKCDSEDHAGQDSTEVDVQGGQGS